MYAGLKLCRSFPCQNKQRTYFLRGELHIVTEAFSEAEATAEDRIDGADEVAYHYDVLHVEPGPFYSLEVENKIECKDRGGKYVNNTTDGDAGLHPIISYDHTNGQI